MGFSNHTPVSTVSRVPSNVATVTLVYENPNRRGVTIFNESPYVLYLKIGRLSSTSSYTCQVPPDSYFETPYGFSGEISGHWSSAQGYALITEIS